VHHEPEVTRYNTMWLMMPKPSLFPNQHISRSRYGLYLYFVTNNISIISVTTRSAYQLYRPLQINISTISVFPDRYIDYSNYTDIFEQAYRLYRYFWTNISIVPLFPDQKIDYTDISGPTYRLYRYFRTIISTISVFQDLHIDYIPIQTIKPIPIPIPI
jgi:hypothetical protein